MPQNRACPECGTTLGGDAPLGLCLKCLGRQAGLAVSTDEHSGSAVLRVRAEEELRKAVVSNQTVWATPGPASLTVAARPQAVLTNYRATGNDNFEVTAIVLAGTDWELQSAHRTNPDAPDGAPWVPLEIRPRIEGTCWKYSGIVNSHAPPLLVRLVSVVGDGDSDAPMICSNVLVIPGRP